MAANKGAATDLLRNTHFLISEPDQNTRYKMLNACLGAVSLLRTFYSEVLDARPTSKNIIQRQLR